MYFFPEGGKLKGTFLDGVVEGNAIYYFPDNSMLKGVCNYSNMSTL
jgi:hypothetical protein